MPDGQRAAKQAAETQAESNLLRDRVTAAIGDRYLVEQEVGRGGMAVVYAAEDVRLQRTVALKVLPPELAFRGDVRERFVREAQTAARLNHPHIVPIYAVHEEGGLVCFAMALVKGESLAARIVREPRPTFEYIAHLLEQVADALAYAHACGVVHRDVKPDTVLIDTESGRPMVTDFGIARAAESGSRLTQTGIAVGTPAFMSPEQATGDREIDGRSDIYSLGVVGYLMLAGRLPFEATTTPAMLLKHVSETPMPIRAVRPDAPHTLVEILERCLAKRPQDRWDNALQLRDALRKVQRDGSLLTGAHRAFAPLAARQPAALEAFLATGAGSVGSVGATAGELQRGARCAHTGTSGRRTLRASVGRLGAAQCAGAGTRSALVARARWVAADAGAAAAPPRRASRAGARVEPRVEGSDAGLAGGGAAAAPRRAVAVERSVR